VTEPKSGTGATAASGLSAILAALAHGF